MPATRFMSSMTCGLAALFWVAVSSFALSSAAENQRKDNSYVDLAAFSFVARGDVAAAIGPGDCPTGFTTLMLQSDKEKTTRVLVSCAFAIEDRPRELRVLAQTKDGKIINAPAFNMSYSGGRKYGVVTMISEFRATHDNIDRLIVQRKKEDD